jgi:hypothetical protein
MDAVKVVKHPETDIDELRRQIAHLSKRDEEITKRLRLHLICITTGIVISISLTFVTIPPALHFGGLFAGIPVYWQEFLDWIKGW